MSPPAFRSSEVTAASSADVRLDFFAMAVWAFGLASALGFAAGVAPLADFAARGFDAALVAVAFLAVAFLAVAALRVVVVFFVVIVLLQIVSGDGWAAIIRRREPPTATRRCRPVAFRFQYATSQARLLP